MGTKISALTTTGAAPTGSYLPLAFEGENYKVTPGNILSSSEVYFESLSIAGSTTTDTLVGSVSDQYLTPVSVVVSLSTGSGCIELQVITGLLGKSPEGCGEWSVKVVNFVGQSSGGSTPNTPAAGTAAAIFLGGTSGTPGGGTDTVTLNGGVSLFLDEEDLYVRCTQGVVHSIRIRYIKTW